MGGRKRNKEAFGSGNMTSRSSSILFLCLTQCLLALATLGGEERVWEASLATVKPSASPEDQTEAVRALLQRLLPDRADQFNISVDPSIGPKGKDTFTVSAAGNNSTVQVLGTSGVAAAWGLHHYLKYSCHAHVSWEADQLSLPDVLPSAQITVTSNDRFRYYQNVCTVSYSMVWWKWERWEREIDWMALNGINLPLTFTGQEAIWHRVYTKMGVTQEELDSHFAGPAFLAWGRMGNIMGWGGPLTASWHNQTLELQHQILERMRQLGITPVLPAFAGHVPKGIARLYPNASISRLGNWAHFTDPYTGTYLLDPSDPLFQTIGSAFLQEMIAEFGTDHAYNCDTFNEMRPSSSDPDYLKSVGSSIFAAMTQVDPDAIWVMQGWLFVNDPTFWHTAQAEALLTSVPIGRMLVLDLASELVPQYSRLQSYFGQPFIFCMLHDYGGVDGLFGNVQVLLQNMAEARAYPNVTLVGTGLTPEGINQNYVMYDLMNEMAWRTNISQLSVSDWSAEYAWRRYGSTDVRLGYAWQLLMRSVYNCTLMLRYHGKNVILARRPKLRPRNLKSIYNVTSSIYNHGQYILVTRPSTSLRPDLIWYSVSDVVEAWDLLVAVARGGRGGGGSEGRNNERGIRDGRRGGRRDRGSVATAVKHAHHETTRVGNAIPRQQHAIGPGVVAGSEATSVNIDPTQRRRLWRSLAERVPLVTSRQDLDISHDGMAGEGRMNVGEWLNRIGFSKVICNGRSEEDDEEVEANADNQADNHVDISSQTGIRKRNREIDERINDIEGESERLMDSERREENEEEEKSKRNEETRRIEEGEEKQEKSIIQEATFKHDLVDVTRQILQITGGQTALTMLKNYDNGVLLAVQESGLLLHDLLSDLDLLLASSPDFLLGRWTSAAASWATDEQEREQYVHNALNQVSLWGPKGEIQDYAIKQWSGVVNSYMRPRWDLFSKGLQEALAEHRSFNETAFVEEVFETVEEPFSTNINATYPSEPQGDAIEIALRLHDKYRPVFDARLIRHFERKYKKQLKKEEKRKRKEAQKRMVKRRIRKLENII